MDLIYLDNNATTQPAPEVVEAMVMFYRDHWGNPSSVHRMGQRARQAVEEARAQLAGLVGCKASQLMFTSGGTESINTAVRSLLLARSPRNKIVTSTVEHSATRELCVSLAMQNVEVVSVRVDTQGRLDLDELAAALDDHTALASFIWANNETGVIAPVERIGEMCREKGVPLHIDATQAMGKIPVDAGGMLIDMLSFAGHKFHGPKGIGGLYVRRGLRIRPLVIGGPQETDRRGGTENVPGIVGLGVAAELAREHLADAPKIRALRDRFEAGMCERVSDAVVNASEPERIVNTSNIAFPRLAAEAMLIAMSEKGVCASAGAACSSGSLEPSPVLQAMNLPSPVALGSIRFSLSRYTTEEEISRALEIIPPVIDRLRRVLPV